MASETYKDSPQEQFAAMDGVSKEMLEKVRSGMSFSGYERDLLSWNRQNGSFLDISGVTGLDSITDGRGAVYADFDNDGDLDVFLRAANGGTRDLLFRNDMGSANEFIRIAVEGRESGRDAVGTIVRVKTAGGVLTRIVEGAAGYLSQSDPRLLFGLGRSNHVEWIDIRWPSGKRQRFSGVSAGDSLLAIEGEDTLRSVDEKRFQLPDPTTPQERRWNQVTLRRGQPLPDLTISNLGGEPTSISNRIPSGKRTLVNLWATWCSACKREIPQLQAISEAGQIEVIGLSVDRPETAHRIPAYLRERNVTYDIYTADADEVSERIFPSDLAIPLSIFLDEEGRVTDVIPGGLRDAGEWTEESSNKFGLQPASDPPR